MGDSNVPKKTTPTKRVSFTPHRDPPAVPKPLTPIARPAGSAMHRRQQSITTPDQARALLRRGSSSLNIPWSQNGTLIDESPEARRLSARAQATIADAARTPTRRGSTTQTGTAATTSRIDEEEYMDIDRVASPIEVSDLSEVDPQVYARNQARTRSNHPANPFANMPRSPLGKRSRTPPRN
jgi:hypothetical protein